MNIKTTLMSSVAAAALFAVAAPAHAGTVANGNDTSSVTLSGHFNYAVMYMDDGEAASTTIVNNNNSTTRGRIVVKGKLNEAVSVGAVSEWAMGSSSSNQVSPSTSTTQGTPVGTGAFFTERHTYVKFDHKQFGSVRLGQTSEATDGNGEKNMTGATDVVYGGNTVVGNAIALRRNNGATAPTTVTVGDLIRHGGEGTRSDVVRYDTPSFGGFGIATSYQADGSADVSGSFSGKFGGFAVGASYGYASLSGSSTTDENTHGGSIAVGHDSGLNFRASMGQVEFKAASRDEAENWSVGGGYKAKLIGTGSTNFAIDYSEFENVSANDDKLTLLSIGVVQNTDAGVNFYLGYQLFQAEQASNVDYEDASTIMAGTKVVF